MPPLSEEQQNPDNTTLQQPQQLPQQQHQQHQQRQQQQQVFQIQQGQQHQRQGGGGGDRDITSSSTHQQRVAQFLADCNLLQYYQLFLAEGFDQIEALLEATELDLIQMGVKRGHRRLLQRAIANARGLPSTPPICVHQNPTYGPLTSPSNEIPPAVTTSPPATLQTPPTTTSLPSIGSLLFLHQTPQSSSSSSSLNTAYQAGAPTAAGNVATAGGGHNSLSSTEEDNAPAENVIVDRGWKRKYQRHAKADVNAPVKPPSAYVMFSNQVRAEVKDQNLSFTEVAKEVGERWKNLHAEEKEQYERRASLARDEYTVALSRYKQTKEYREYQRYLAEFNLKYGARAGSSRGGKQRTRRRGASDNTTAATAVTVSSSIMPTAAAAAEPPAPSSSDPDPGLP